MTTRVLIVDPDPRSRELHRLALGFVGNDVRAVGSGNDAELEYDVFRPEVVVVTVGAGAGDGTRFAARLRRAGEPARLVVLAGPGPVPPIRGGGDAPSDSVLVRPVDLDDLVGAVAAATGVRNASLAVGDLVLDDRSACVSRGDDSVDLSPTEYRLLRLLMLNAGRVMSKADILDHVWRYDFGGRTNAVETYISYLRRKLGPLGGPSIVTVRGSGYVLRPEHMA